MLHINRSQHLVLALFLILLFYFAAAPLSWARADNGSDLPTRADVQAQLDTLNKQKGPAEAEGRSGAGKHA